MYFRDRDIPKQNIQKKNIYDVYFSTNPLSMDVIRKKNKIVFFLIIINIK